MYSILVTTHSILRWLVIGAGLLAAVHAWRASSWRSPATAPAAGVFFTVFFDVQLLVGLSLYFFLSPITTAALHRFRAAMSNDIARFWLVEHPFGMLVALVLAHVGRAKSRRAVEDQRQRRLAAIYFTLAIVIVLLAAPWPFMRYGRPLL
jgi:hypothetical protein